jgi:hypothetical protein
MERMAIELGWYPGPLHFNFGDIEVSPLPDWQESVASVKECDGIADGWIYAPPQRVRVMGQGWSTRPYPSRVFGLPKTHRLDHASADCAEHLDFLTWALGFFVGMRLTTTEAGFLDATPVSPGKLVDFILPSRGEERAMARAERFWQGNKAHPLRAHRWTAAVHALFLSHNPLALQFERFIFLYCAIDACFALAREVHPIAGRIAHAHRVDWLCSLFQMATPTWATPSGNGSPIANIRNDAVHEALFVGAPLGFNAHGVGTGVNLIAEMQALACRLLVALLGDVNANYLKTSVSSMQMQTWSP